MSDTAGDTTRSKFFTAVMWSAAVFLLYLLSSGPVTRWSPMTANVIYAPLSPIAESDSFGKPLRGWLSIWGVGDDSRVQQPLKTPPTGGALLVSTDTGLITISNNPITGAVMKTNN